MSFTIKHALPAVIAAALLSFSCSEDSNIFSSSVRDDVTITTANQAAVVANVTTSPPTLYNGVTGYVHIDYNDDYRSSLVLLVDSLSYDSDITATVVNSRLVRITPGNWYEGTSTLYCTLIDGTYRINFSVPIVVTVKNPMLDVSVSFSPLSALASTMSGGSTFTIDVSDFMIDNGGIGDVVYSPVTNLSYEQSGTVYTFNSGYDPGTSYVGFEITSVSTIGGITQVVSTSAVSGFQVVNQLSGHVVAADGFNLAGCQVQLLNNGIVYSTSNVRRDLNGWRFDFPIVGGASYSCQVLLDRNENDVVDEGDYYGFAINPSDDIWDEVLVHRGDNNVTALVYPIKGR